MKFLLKGKKMKRRITIAVLLGVLLGAAVGCKSMYEQCMETGLYPDAYCRGLHDGWWSGHGRFHKQMQPLSKAVYDEGWDDGMTAGTAAAQRSATWGAAAWNH